MPALVHSLGDIGVETRERMDWEDHVWADVVDEREKVCVERETNRGMPLGKREEMGGARPR